MRVSNGSVIVVYPDATPGQHPVGRNVNPGTQFGIEQLTNPLPKIFKKQLGGEYFQIRWKAHGLEVDVVVLVEIGYSTRLPRGFGLEPDQQRFREALLNTIRDKK